MKTQDSRTTSPNTVKYETTLVDELNIAYREAGNPQNPKLVLLHGFPASSHQYRNLIPAPTRLTGSLKAKFIQRFYDEKVTPVVQTAASRRAG